jgi:hypothetical protein
MIILSVAIILSYACWQFEHSGRKQMLTIVDPREVFQIAEVAYFGAVLAWMFFVLLTVYSFTRGIAL